MTRHENQAQYAHKLGNIIQACNEAKLRAVIDAQEQRIASLESLLRDVGARHSGDDIGALIFLLLDGN